MADLRWELTLLLGDVILFLIAIPLLLAWLYPIGQWNAVPFKPDMVLILIMGLYFAVLYVSDLYDKYKDYRAPENISRLLFAVWLGMLLGIGVLRLAPTFLSRRFLEWHALIFGLLLVAWRISFSAFAFPQRLQRRILIIGAGDAGRQLIQLIQSRPNSGFKIIGLVDDDPAKKGLCFSGVPVLGSSQELLQLIADQKIDLVVLAVIRERSPQLMRTLGYLAFNHCHLVDLPLIYEKVARKIPVDYISDSWLYLHSIYQSKIYYRHLKRLFDLILATFGLIITAPLFPIISLAIKLDSQGPVFFCQPRLGQAGKVFKIIKFRTMTTTPADSNCSWTTQGDPRITRVGRFLRRTHLDELPQLINVLKGEMSLIGPRAEWDIYALQSQEEEVLYRPGRRATDPPGLMVPVGRRERIPHYSFRSVVKPGITGWAQVMFPMAGSSQEELKEKLAYDLYYIKNLSLFLDLAILLKTIRIVLVGRGK